MATIREIYNVLFDFAPADMKLDWDNVGLACGHFDAEVHKILVALDAGAADFQPEEGCFTVYTDPADFNDVAKALEDKGYKFESAQIEMVPQNYQKLENPEDISNMEKMLDIFEDDDDVQNVWHNWDQE